MKAQPRTLKAYEFLQAGVQTLSKVEANGIRIDVPYLKRVIKKTTRRIDLLKENLESDPVMKTWRKMYANKTNIFSPHQLALVLFDKMGFESPEKTAKGKAKTDEATLEQLDIPFVKRYLKLSKLQRAVNTYLRGILRDTVDGFLHPVFSLHLVETYRSSSESPNFQNIPVRIPWMKELVRPAFIPRPGHIFTEADYKGLEVRISCCYHKDPKLIEYVCNPKLDMHREMAAQCFACDEDQITPALRYGGKNGFVFPQFYGAYYLSCAQAIWQDYVERGAKLNDGTSLRKHLKSKDIFRLGHCDPDRRPRPNTFEKHIQQVEDHFWNERFPVYKQWKEDWWATYQRRGGFRMLSDFVVNGVHRRNEVINYPVQDSAFHCLLWSLIKLQEWIERTGSKVKLIGQIHDSIVADVPEEEFEKFTRVMRRIMTVEIRKAWPWIIIPLDIEVEIAHEGESWADKKEYEIR